MLQCVGCSMLQCVAVCCSVTGVHKTGCTSVHHDTHRTQHTHYSHVLQCVAVCCSVKTLRHECHACAQVALMSVVSAQEQCVCCSVLQCVAVCCSVLQCVAVCCRVLQCVAVCCSVKRQWHECHSCAQVAQECHERIKSSACCVSRACRSSHATRNTHAALVLS